MKNRYARCILCSVAIMTFGMIINALGIPDFLNSVKGVIWDIDHAIQ